MKLSFPLTKSGRYVNTPKSRAPVVRAALDAMYKKKRQTVADRDAFDEVLRFILNAINHSKR